MPFLECPPMEGQRFEQLLMMHALWKVTYNSCLSGQFVKLSFSFKMSGVYIVFIGNSASL